MVTTRGPRGDAVAVPDTLSLGEYIEARGEEGTPEWRAWCEKRRVKR